MIELTSNERKLVEDNPLLDYLGSILAPVIPPGLKRLELARGWLFDWEDALLGIASEYVLGFNIFQSSDDSAALADINNKLDQIQQSLSALNAKLDTIIELLTALPKVVAGIVDSAFSKQWLISAKSDVGSIKDKTQDLLTFNANKLAVDALVSDLEKSINEVWGFSGNGALAATLTASSVGVWAQTKAMLLRDQGLNPSHLTIKDMTMFKTLKSSFGQLFPAWIQSKSTAVQTYKDTPHWSGGNPLGQTNPPQCWEFNAVITKFAPQLIENSARQQYKGSQDFSPPHGSGTHGRDILWATIPPFGGFPHAYAPVDFNARFIDPQNVAAARQAWPSFSSNLNQAITTVTFLWNLDQAIKGIDNALS